MAKPVEYASPTREREATNRDESREEPKRFEGVDIPAEGLGVTGTGDGRD